MNPDDTSSPSPQLMQLRVKELQFLEGEWPCASDRLARHTEIENLSPVLLHAQAPLVFAIDASWGGGKTTFIRLWRHYLDKESKVSLYLNAWESDFAEDPLLPMLATLDEWLSGKPKNSKAKKAWDKAKALAPSMLRASVVAGVRVATLGAIDADKAVEGVVAAATGEVAGSIVDSFNSKLSALAEFKKQLKNALDGLPDGQQNLIVFLDELDRCKPTYAIEVLERIKHLFDIDRLVFVLAINREQLSRSLQGVYGPSFDGLHYLKRFIDLDYQLRVTDIATYIDASIRHPDILAYFKSRKSDSDGYEFGADIIKVLSIRFHYTPRDIDQLITRLRLVLRSIPQNHYLDIALLISLMILRQENAEIYRNYVINSSKTNNAVEFLLGGGIGEVTLDHTMAVVAGYLIGAARDRYDDQSLESLTAPWKGWLDSIEQNDKSREEVALVLTIASDRREFFSRGGVRELTFNRIELVHKINVT